MKKIYFNHLRFKHWSQRLLYSCIFYVLLFGFFEIIVFTNLEINKKVSALGYILTAIYY
jgi:hypothetical protein